jgi:hypothetical protein
VRILSGDFFVQLSKTTLMQTTGCSK